MSQLQLSAELLNEIQQVVVKHDAQAEDAGVTVQYLAAVIGFMMGQQQTMDDATRKDLLNQLFAFAQHVMEDVAQPQQQAPAQEAFGVWRANKG